MPAKFRTAGPSCACPSCTIFSDEFTTDRTGTDYNIGAGSCTVSGGVLNTGSAPFLITTNATTSGAATAAHVAAQINMASTADKGQLILAYADSTHYWYAEFQPGATSGTIRIFEVSGSATQRATLAVSGFGTGNVTCCFSIASGFGTASVLIAGAAKAVTCAASPTIASTAAGMGVGAISGSITFDDFSFNKHKADDASCSACTQSCTTCLNGIAPPVMQAIVSGFSGPTPGPCPPSGGDYAGLDGTYEMAYDPSPPGGCGWISTAYPCPNPLKVYTYDHGGGDFWLEADAFPGTYILDNGGTRVDCYNLSGVSVPLLGTAFGFTGTAGTVTVTAIA